MVKVLSQSGNSLADIYDAQGSIAGIDQLETTELPIVHEMGATIFSERVSGFILRATTGNINQDTDWDVIVTDAPTVPTRVLGVQLFANDGARVLRSMVALRFEGAEREFPLYAWDSNESIIQTRMQDDGGTVAVFDLLVTNLNFGQGPSMLIGSQQPQSVGDIAFRGRTTGFGAGTVFIVALLYLSFSAVTGLSSRGLPIPGW